jgi:hypothetical protein
MCDKHDFVFEFDKAYTAQLIEKFEASPQHNLVMDVATPKKGVYALYHRGKLVYAGKALNSDWYVRAGEHALITSYKPEWNASGFGSHIPGRGRPGIKTSKWDSMYPSKTD